MIRQLFLIVTCLATSALLPALVPSVALGQALDTIYLTKGGQPNRGTISDMNKNEVIIDISGVPRTFGVNEISRITYADEPNEVASARNAIVQSNWNTAFTELRKLEGQAIDRSVIKQDVDYFKALVAAKMAMTEGGDKAAAEKAMLDFVRSSPASYHFYDAAETLGDLAVSSGKYAEAAKYYGPIATAPWGDYQMRANNAIGRALTAQKQYPDAIARYDAVIDGALSTPEAATQKTLAAIGKAVCLAATGKADEGLTMVKDIIAKNDPTDVVLFARANNALGNCYLKTGKNKDALMAFLHTDILFYADSESHAEALYHLSKLWAGEGKPDRATAARSTLRERYSGSVWATLE